MLVMETQAVAPATHYEGGRLEALLSISDVAGVLGVSRATIYALMRSGELVPIRVGERARFEPADVRSYLERHREERAP
jgi:excisionase family DNA binding protein